jgi:hypothetical protein
MLSYYLRVSLKVLMLMGSKFTVNEWMQIVLVIHRYDWLL